MAKNINGQTWYYIDTVCDDDLVYDVYENELTGEVIYEIIDTLY